MIIPVNDHILIDPLKHESFISSGDGTYEEIGVVVELPISTTSEINRGFPCGKGDKVFFDSWMAAKYPKNDKEWYWLVKWDDVRAIEKNNADV